MRYQFKKGIITMSYCIYLRKSRKDRELNDLGGRGNAEKA